MEEDRGGDARLPGRSLRALCAAGRSAPFSIIGRSTGSETIHSDRIISASNSTHAPETAALFIRTMSSETSISRPITLSNAIFRIILAGMPYMKNSPVENCLPLQQLHRRLSSLVARPAGETKFCANRSKGRKFNYGYIISSFFCVTVPLGRQTIARQFIAGIAVRSVPSPVGTTEWLPRRCFLSSLRDFAPSPIPPRQ